VQAVPRPTDRGAPRKATSLEVEMAGTSRTPDPDVPVPPGGGAGERLREFLAAREEPAPAEQTGSAEDDDAGSADEGDGAGSADQGDEEDPRRRR